MNSNQHTKDIMHPWLEHTTYAVVWAVVFSIPFLVQTYDLLAGEVQHFDWHKVTMGLRSIVPVFLLFVLNNYVLLPKLFWQHRKVLYFLSLALLLALMWCLQESPSPHPLMDEMPVHMPHGALPPRPPKPVGAFDMFRITNLIIQLCVLLANFGIKLYIQSVRRDMLMLNIQNEKMMQEVQSLKYQISPHFLMNTLNNIQSLIESDPDRAGKTIQQLSHMMRYLLYDNKTQSVTLGSEVEFMRNFIELMRIRYPETVKIAVDFPTEHLDTGIPPLLFISFIENAFKYGVSYDHDSMISISLTVQGNHLMFCCANFETAGADPSRQSTGIGIKNVRRRLDLLYGNDYTLNLSQTGGMFVVEMRIPFDNEHLID